MLSYQVIQGIWEMSQQIFRFFLAAKFNRIEITVELLKTDI